ncbi:MAG TPA: hypothetical protein VMU30_01695 [Bacteroidota bacterium]|nr:hypothetical protein [Bacteroidota bacterium]
MFSQNRLVGMFEGSGDIGDVMKKGSVFFDASAKTYTMIGGGEIDVLAKLTGGEGMFDVNPWSPDSKEITFVSYRVAHK